VDQAFYSLSWRTSLYALLTGSLKAVQNGFPAVLSWQAASNRDGRNGGGGLFDASSSGWQGVGIDTKPGFIGVAVFVQGGIGGGFAVAR